MKKYVLVAIPMALMLVMGMLGGALLQAQSPQSFTVLTASKILKARVKEMGGQDLGQIANLIIETNGGQGPQASGAPAVSSTPQASETPTEGPTSQGSATPGASPASLARGKILYAVLTLPGSSTVQGSGPAVPWSLFTYEPAQNDFVVAAPAGQIKGAPQFDAASGTASPTWAQEVQSYWQSFLSQGPGATASASAPSGSGSSSSETGTPPGTASSQTGTPPATASSETGTPPATQTGTPTAPAASGGEASNTSAGVAIYSLPATAQVWTATPTFTPLPGADSLVGRLPNLNSVAQGPAAGGVGEPGHDPGISIGTHLSRSAVIPTPPVSTFGEGVHPAATASIGGQISQPGARVPIYLTPTYAPEGQGLGVIRPEVAQQPAQTPTAQPQELTHAQTPIVTEVPTPIPTSTPGPTPTPTPAATATPSPTSSSGAGSGSSSSGAAPSASETAQPSASTGAASTQGVLLEARSILDAAVQDPAGTKAGTLVDLMVEVNMSGSQAGGNASTGTPNATAGTTGTSAATATGTSAASATATGPSGPSPAGIQQGGVAYAVVAAGSRQVLVPWGLLVYQPSNKAFVLNAPPAALQNAPGPSAISQNQLSSPGWDSALAGYWLAQPAGANAGTGTPAATPTP